MTQEIIPPENIPPQNNQSLGFAGSLMSAVGIGLMMLTMLGSAGAATIWAFGRLFGVPDWMTLPFHAVTGLLVLAVTVWATGRAWHVEKLLMQGKDVDQPVFKLFHYFQRDARHES
jgi:hypothetical protein